MCTTGGRQIGVGRRKNFEKRGEKKGGREGGRSDTAREDAKFGRGGKRKIGIKG